MKKEDLVKAWTAAVVISAAISCAIVIYAVFVEVVTRSMPFKPPFSGPTAAVVRYALFILGAAAVLAARYARGVMEPRSGTAPEILQALVKQNIVTAAICEIPALLGLMLFVLVGGYWDFYLLAAFCAAAELVYFPKYAVWEEKLRYGGGFTPE